MKGKTFIVIGMTGTGKSTWVRDNCLGNSNYLIYDVNNEYRDVEESKTGKESQCRISSMKVDFELLENIIMKRRNSNIIIEESTGLFRFRASSNVMKILINKRHTNNNYIFLFHSVKQVPKDLFELCNFVVLFKTNDLEVDLKKRPELMMPFFRNKRSSNQFVHEVIKLQ